VEQQHGRDQERDPPAPRIEPDPTQDERADDERAHGRIGHIAEPLLEEAIGDAINKVLQRVTNYWTADLNKGLQYKLIFKVLGEFDEDATEEIQEEISDVIDSEFDLNKENIVTDKTMDYLVWAKKSDYKKSSKIYRMFKKKLKKKAKIKKININRKLIILGVEEAE